jgi:hypothetical protein
MLDSLIDLGMTKLVFSLSIQRRPALAVVEVIQVWGG